jgi:hypothetical protein
MGEPTNISKKLSRSQPEDVSNKETDQVNKIRRIEESVALDDGINF